MNYQYTTEDKLMIALFFTFVFTFILAFTTGVSYDNNTTISSNCTNQSIESTTTETNAFRTQAQKALP